MNGRVMFSLGLACIWLLLGIVLYQGLQLPGQAAPLQSETAAILAALMVAWNCLRAYMNWQPPRAPSPGAEDS